jgi:hypothetical protein
MFAVSSVHACFTILNAGTGELQVQLTPCDENGTPLDPELPPVETPGIDSTQIEEILTVENQDLVDKALSGAPGLVLLPPHMGNWRFGRRTDCNAR